MLPAVHVHFGSRSDAVRIICTRDAAAIDDSISAVTPLIQPVLRGGERHSAGKWSRMCVYRTRNLACSKQQAVNQSDGEPSCVLRVLRSQLWLHHYRMPIGSCYGCHNRHSLASSCALGQMASLHFTSLCPVQACQGSPAQTPCWNCSLDHRCLCRAFRRLVWGSSLGWGWTTASDIQLLDCFCCLRVSRSCWTC